MSTEYGPAESTPPQGAAPKQDSSLADDIKIKGHRVVDNVADRVDVAERQLREKQADLTARGQEASDRAQEELARYKSEAEAYARKNPLAATGIAFAAGVVLAAILRR